MTIVERAAYLKGLTEGLGVEPDSRDGKLWAALTDLLSDMAHEIEDLQSGSLDFADALDEIGDELSYLEDLTCDLDRPEDADDFCSGECDSCEYDCFSDEEEEEEEESSAPSAARRSPLARRRSRRARSCAPSAAKRWSSTSPARTTDFH